MKNIRIEVFKKKHPDLNFSHFEFPENWSKRLEKDRPSQYNLHWKEIKAIFNDGKFYLMGDTNHREILDLLEELLSKIYQDMCDRILAGNFDN